MSNPLNREDVFNLEFMYSEFMATRGLHTGDHERITTFDDNARAIRTSLDKVRVQVGLKPKQKGLVVVHG